MFIRFPKPTNRPMPPESNPMTDKKKLKDYREKLLAKHKELTKGFTRSKTEATQQTTGTGTEDFVDYAVNAYTKEFLLSLADTDRRILVLVDEALERIQRNEFGVCLECSKAIGEKRLQAVPWTPYCISCQERIEQSESSRTPVASRPPLAGD